MSRATVTTFAVFAVAALTCATLLLHKHAAHFCPSGSETLGSLPAGPGPCVAPNDAILQQSSTAAVLPWLPLAVAAIGAILAWALSGRYRSRTVLALTAAATFIVFMTALLILK